LQRAHVFIGPQRTNGGEAHDQERKNESFHHLEIGYRRAPGRERNSKRAFLVQIGSA
jgi:hypothetical protein